MELTDILNTLRRWLAGVDLPAQVLTDQSDALRVIFETENTLAELLAGNGEYAPYRHVSFTVLDTRLALTAPPVYCFYDDETSTAEDILRALDKGLELFRA